MLLVLWAGLHLLGLAQSVLHKTSLHLKSYLVQEVIDNDLPDPLFLCCYFLGSETNTEAWVIVWAINTYLLQPLEVTEALRVPLICGVPSAPPKLSMEKNSFWGGMWWCVCPAFLPLRKILSPFPTPTDCPAATPKIRHKARLRENSSLGLQLLTQGWARDSHKAFQGWPGDFCCVNRTNVRVSFRILGCWAQVSLELSCSHTVKDCTQYRRKARETVSYHHPSSYPDPRLPDLSVTGGGKFLFIYASLHWASVTYSHSDLNNVPFPLACISKLP